MNLGFKLSAVLAAVSVLGGCASSCGAPGETADAPPETNIVVPVEREAPTPAGNANVEMVNGLDPKGGKNPTLDNSKVRVVDTTKVKTEPPKKRLPDGSEIMTTMNKEGHFVEIRRFPDHPDLEKLVRTIRSGKDIRFEVHLKNGKVHPLPEGKLENYRKASAGMILEAVGVKPTVVKRPPAATKEEEMKKRGVMPRAVPEKN